MSKLWSIEYKKKLILPGEIEIKAASIKQAGQKIATLNGSFDLLHAGHLQIIFAASELSDVLIVALNSDDSIKKYKSPDRPLIPLEYRLQMMAALEFVDYVTWFHETDPRAILEKIKPDVHINGAEYGTNCIESETIKKYGGTLHIEPLVPSLSTSQIINQIAGLTK